MALLSEKKYIFCLVVSVNFESESHLHKFIWLHISPPKQPTSLDLSYKIDLDFLEKINPYYITVTQYWFKYLRPLILVRKRTGSYNGINRIISCICTTYVLVETMTCLSVGVKASHGNVVILKQFAGSEI